LILIIALKSCVFVRSLHFNLVSDLIWFKMDNTAVELKFREALFLKYSHCEKYLLPMDVYYTTVSDLRLAAATETNSSHIFWSLWPWQNVKNIKEKYANILTKDSFELFKSYCVDCQEKRKHPKTNGVVKPFLSRLIVYSSLIFVQL